MYGCDWVDVAALEIASHTGAKSRPFSFRGLEISDEQC